MHYTNTNEILNLSTQSFSHTDLNLDENNLGIVYPYDNKETIPLTTCVSSIIDHHNGDNFLMKHTEVRTAETKDNKLVYDKINQSTSLTLINISQAQSAIRDMKFYSENYAIKNNNTRLNAKLELYKKFEPIFFIDSANLKQKYYAFESMTPPTIFPTEPKHKRLNKTKKHKLYDKLSKLLVEGSEYQKIDKPYEYFENLYQSLIDEDKEKYPPSLLSDKQYNNLRVTHEQLHYFSAYELLSIGLTPSKLRELVMEYGDIVEELIEFINGKSSKEMFNEDINC